MTSLQVKTFTNPVQRAAKSVQRAAFTLVELMIVILIIGLLAGIATPVIFSAMTTTRQFTITNEVQQMSAAIERFKTDHGFYPPAIGPGMAINTLDTNPTTGGLATFRKFLNRIAPNNAEASSGGLTRWWTTVGTNLNQDSSLVFWLSGLCTSKQYPLSGNAFIANSTNANQRLCSYNANNFVNDSAAVDGNGVAISIDRNVFFEFKSGQLVSATPNTTATLGIKVYNQPNGKGDNLAYLYRDFRSYMAAGAPAYHSGDPTVPTNFFNPNKFQLLGPGMDGVISTQNPVVTDLADSTAVDPAQDDNIVNFTENGRLDQAYE